MISSTPLYFAAKAFILENQRFLALKRSEENGDLWESPDNMYSRIDVWIIRMPTRDIAETIIGGRL